MIRHFFTDSLLFVVSLFALASIATAETTVPHTFSANTTAKSSEVNANFEALSTAIDAIQLTPGTTAWTDNIGTVSTLLNVGIGTTSPNELLEINGNLRLPATTATTGIIKLDANTYIHSFGVDNFFAGALSGNLTMSGRSNTASGAFSLFNNTEGSGNTASGVSALSSNTTGDDNTASGFLALQQNTTGDRNTASGKRALQNNTSGNDNTASGDLALLKNTFGRNNTAFGRIALLNSTTGHGNTAVGRNALSENITGSNNTALGHEADTADGTTDLTNATAIGYRAKVGASNSLVLGGTGFEAVNVGIGTTTPNATLHVIGNIVASGTITASAGIASSRVLKEEIQALSQSDAALALSQLNPVTFKYKTDENNDLQLGFIAEDVPEMVSTPERKGIIPMDIIAVLTKVMQKQQIQIAELQNQVNALSSR